MYLKSVSKYNNTIIYSTNQHQVISKQEKVRDNCKHGNGGEEKKEFIWHHSYTLIVPFFIIIVSKEHIMGRGVIVVISKSLPIRYSFSFLAFPCASRADLQHATSFYECCVWCAVDVVDSDDDRK